MASSYQVDPDALFSDDEGAVASPSPKRARVTPVAPRPPSLGPLKLPSYGTASLSGRSSSSTSAPSSTSSIPYSQRQNHYSRPSNPYAQARPSLGRGTTHRPSHTRYSRPSHPPRPYAPVTRHITDPPRGPMGRGRAATLPAHVTQRNPPRSQEDEIKTAREKSITAAASILPEADRASYIEKKLKEKQASSSIRKRPSRQKVLSNIKNSRKGKFTGLSSLLQAANNSNKNLIRLEGSKHRMHKPEKAHTVYAEATMTKEMIEREEREKIQREQELEQELERVHIHFRQMRQREREEREWMARKWRREETVAGGMRYAYRLAKTERYLFEEEPDAKCRTLQHWGLTLLPEPEDEKVTEMMTIHIEEI